MKKVELKALFKQLKSHCKKLNEVKDERRKNFIPIREKINTYIDLIESKL